MPVPPLAGAGAASWRWKQSSGQRSSMRLKPATGCPLWIAFTLLRPVMSLCWLV